MSLNFGQIPSLTTELAAFELLKKYFHQVSSAIYIQIFLILADNQTWHNTRDVFYVRREVDLMKTAKVNAYIMHIFGKIELLSIHAI